MRKRTRRKLKVYAVDAAMIFLAIQLTVVVRGGEGEIEAFPAPEETVAYVEEKTAKLDATEWTMLETEDETENAETVNMSETLIKSRDWGADDAEILLKIAMAEAEGESVEGKALVMLVVLNRVWSEGFPDSIPEVVFQEGQFTPTNEGGRYWSTVPDEECYMAYDMVLHGWDESQGALYFSATGSSTWMDENTEYLFTVGNHSFYK